jgi:hypothetical protein
VELTVTTLGPTVEATAATFIGATAPSVDDFESTRSGLTDVAGAVGTTIDGPEPAWS